MTPSCLYLSIHWRFLVFGCCCFWLLSCTPASEDGSSSPPNILFISIDDLRPELGCYGVEAVKSPHLDGLASEATVFTRAYCQAAICMPSRSSMLSGLRPEQFDSSGRLNARSIDANAPGVITLPQYLKSQGYQTVSIGKIYHHDGEDAAGWSQRYDEPLGTAGGISYAAGYAKPLYRQAVDNYLKAWADRSLMDSVRPPAVEVSERPDSLFPDGKVARYAVQELQRLSQGEQPFFLAVGFYRPHLPFVVPQRYWDLYEEEAIALAENPFLPVNGIGYHDWNELRRYGDIPREGPLSEAKAQGLKRGYYASVSFVDAQVGKVLAQLEALGLAENTLVVVIGDHGWNLGEHTLWCKHSNYEVSTRTAMLMRIPGEQVPRQTDSLCGLIDLYPTICDYVGLPRPAHVQGQSLRPILTGQQTTVQDRVFSLYFDSYSMRTERYRLTRYFDPQKLRNSPIDTTGRYELYDHLTDPQENHNLAFDPTHQALLQRLLEEMDEYGFLPEEGN